MLADAAYPCLDWIITPFKDNGNLTREQKKFNKKHHAPTRVHIERAFGLLKGRFRKMKSLEMSNVENMNEIVIAVACLHNICLQNGDLGEEYIDPEDYDPNLFENIFPNDNIGTEKRDHLVALVNNF